MVNLQKFWDLGRPPPPCWEKFPNNIVFLYESVPNRNQKDNNDDNGRQGDAGPAERRAEERAARHGGHGREPPPLVSALVIEISS